MRTTAFHRICFVILLLLAGTTAFAQSTIPYGNNPATGKYVVLNGVRHYYEVYGTGAPMLLIHGNGTGIKGWAAQIEYFSKKYTVYAIDCRGRGKSDLGPDSLSYAQMASDMAAFITTMKLDSVSVVGKSDGGIVGILMGIHYPAHLKKIVAFGANLQPDSTALYPQTVREIAADRANADKMLALKDTSQNWKLIQQRNRMMEFQPHITAADLARIQIPVLVMSCDRDLIQPQHILWIYQHIPHADLCILPNATHHVPRQEPKVFNEAVDRYLSMPYMPESVRFQN